MYSFEIDQELLLTLRVLARRDHALSNAVQKKIAQICASSNPHQYKNLRYDLKMYKRVHIKGSFVLLFRIDETRKQIIFECLEHHDKVYER